MSAPCVYGGECSGCGMCRREAGTAYCAVCGRPLEPDDRAAAAADGTLVCDDPDCLFATACADCGEEELADFARCYMNEFIAQYKIELFEAAIKRGRAFFTQDFDPLRDFAGGDQACFCEWWMDRNNISYVCCGELSRGD